jgi:3-deoxy-D-manno-octulosonic-acid transferase
MENFLWAMDVVKDYTIVVENAAALGQAIGAVLANPAEYASRAEAAREALAQAQGATARYVDAIVEEP